MHAVLDAHTNYIKKLAPLAHERRVRGRSIATESNKSLHEHLDPKHLHKEINV